MQTQVCFPSFPTAYLAVSKFARNAERTKRFHFCFRKNKREKIREISLSVQFGKITRTHALTGDVKKRETDENGHTPSSSRYIFSPEMPPAKSTHRFFISFSPLPQPFANPSPPVLRRPPAIHQKLQQSFTPISPEILLRKKHSKTHTCALPLPPYLSPFHPSHVVAWRAITLASLLPPPSPLLRVSGTLFASIACSFPSLPPSDD